MTAHYERFHPRWRKSPYSTNGGDCVEIAVSTGGQHAAGPKPGTQKLYMIRDSKDPDGPRLYFTPAEWHAFTRGMKDGAFDDLS
jgi:hypothetical protein